MKLSRREALLLFVLAVLVVVFLGTQYLVLPQYRLLNTRKQDLDALKDQQITLDSAVKTLGVIGDSLGQAYDEAALASQAYAASIDQEQLDHWLSVQVDRYMLARQRLEMQYVSVSDADYYGRRNLPGAPLPTIAVQSAADGIARLTQPQDGEEAADPAATAEQLYCTTVTLGVSGPYKSIASFVNSLYASSRPLVVDRLTITDFDDTNKMAILVIRFFAAPQLTPGAEQLYVFPTPEGQEALMPEPVATPTPTPSPEPTPTPRRR